MLKISKQLKSLSLKQLAGFSGHQVKEYDWRDDESKN